MKIFAAFFFGILMILFGLLLIKLGNYLKKDQDMTSMGFSAFIGAAIFIISAILWILDAVNLITIFDK